MTQKRAVHYMEYATDKTTRCGRTLTPHPLLVTTDKAKATCGQCLTPNRPFTGGGYYQKKP